MAIQFDDIVNEDMDASKLSRILDISILDLEPYLIDVKDSLYELSVKGFFQWLKSLVVGKSEDEVLDTVTKRGISWIMLLELSTDDITHSYLKGREIDTISNVAQRIGDKIIESIKFDTKNLP